jgi:hypothetical protein
VADISYYLILIVNLELSCYLLIMLTICYMCVFEMNYFVYVYVIEIYHVFEMSLLGYARNDH